MSDLNAIASMSVDLPVTYASRPERIAQEPHYSKETRQLIAMIEEARGQGYDEFVIHAPLNNIGWQIKPVGMPRCMRG